MKRLSVFLFLFAFSFAAWNLPAMAADQSSEIERLKGEIQKMHSGSLLKAVISLFHVATIQEPTQKNSRYGKKPA